MELNDLEIYRHAKELAQYAWSVYEKLSWQDKKTMGDQFLSSTDSVGANIAEGFGRYHYLDKNKFSYNARGSLLESIHWLETLQERGKIEGEIYATFLKKADVLHRKLNAYIRSTRMQKES